MVEFSLRECRVEEDEDQMMASVVCVRV